jgi:hypothetical protein
MRTLSFLKVSKHSIRKKDSKTNLKGARLAGNRENNREKTTALTVVQIKDTAEIIISATNGELNN